MIFYVESSIKIKNMQEKQKRGCSAGKKSNSLDKWDDMW
jgi:hypothetical protein